MCLCLSICHLIINPFIVFSQRFLNQEILDALEAETGLATPQYLTHFDPRISSNCLLPRDIPLSQTSSPFGQAVLSPKAIVLRYDAGGTKFDQIRVNYR